jgi:rRNA maturation RNase YbeY
VSINFYYEDVTALHLDKGSLRGWISSAIREENQKAGNLNFIFCSDGYLLKINQEFLKHDYYTDVVTFDYVEGDLVSGDIFVSVERVSENAGIYQVSFQNELERVIIHGVLHLLGYGDEDIEHKIEMTKKENYYLAGRQEL